MGRRRRAPVTISTATEVSTEVAAGDGLPQFRSFIDVRRETATKNEITRVFFVCPTQEEMRQTAELRDSKTTSRLHVVSARMPYMPVVRPTTPVFEHCRSLGFSEDFSTDATRLLIYFLEGKLYSVSTLRQIVPYINEFYSFVSRHKCNHPGLTHTEISKEVWNDYLEKLESDPRTTAKHIFNIARGIYAAYRPTNLGGTLAQFSFREHKNKDKKPAREHTSELAETRDYSDSVMYQLLALFLESVQRRIGYRKYYEELIEADMPKDWVRKGTKREKQEKPPKERIAKWLADPDEGYQILIDHHIMWHKSASTITSDERKSKRTGFVEKLYRTTDLDLVQKFYEAMARTHGYTFGPGPGVLLDFYVKRRPGERSSPVTNQIAWGVANILMMFTGINKEVALSIPSKTDNGKSILTRSDNTFIASDEESNEIVLFGWKERTGLSPRKQIEISLPKASLMHSLLHDYEKYVKVEKDGPFFEVSENFDWPTAGKIYNFKELYPVLGDNREYLSSIDSTRFRKVFASGQLLDRLKGVRDGNELAEKLRDDLNQKDIDTTITHYLLKSSAARGVIDIAIATITSEKLKDALKFKGTVILAPTINAKKKTFLCDCEDPTNPSHSIAIAAECKHYDLCLGCERSLICKEHLPYICVRILQYEDARRKDPHIWAATFEDKWMIAQDALDNYAKRDKKQGQELVDQAWVTARLGLVSLPPIIMSNRM